MEGGTHFSVRRGTKLVAPRSIMGKKTKKQVGMELEELRMEMEKKKMAFQVGFCVGFVVVWC